VQERLLGSAGELVATLRDVFGLNVPEVADLWPKVVARHEEILALSAANSANENSAA
jgi:hypothetical protein